MSFRVFLSAITIMAIAGCAATGPIGYGPADERGFGYQESRIESDRYRITYNGSGGMPPDIVEDYALRRAAELALENGADWFRVVSRDVSKDQRGGVNVGAGFGTGSFGRRSSVGIGVGGDLGRVGAQDFFTVRLQVLIGNGETPDDPDVYSASDLLSSFSSQP